jgi:hypothetical protein
MQASCSATAILARDLILQRRRRRRRAAADVATSMDALWFCLYMDPCALLKSAAIRQYNVCKQHCRQSRVRGFRGSSSG